ncbi:BTB/POZ domain-containing protein KCTD14 isoform 1-T5 [Dama dama]|uniref:BTB/POZ domain-containing protein KCTD14 isoform X1 n=1 Tax=Dama dama TaxID=30532 RepID=UPI002A35E7BA|nr:BTB/POZ domain-containing protein KCTD14 isoform X1 [Dama dama]XP_061024137.1 BTB/POZ domain-containing protein KCTD14 isoform X1 [Dama dama]XP_061024148.1 BTB/POZ domain-containing protein KCTD14 isoform X1 [Dama dama]XP_061024154.1 BTB/POZ domain-containing protein KCTD14 isoform X1 [Dama dama]XP_061024162.1 BTB/POZ domain-containing protein KCTD14 isoform X1 [Dama dama]
MQSSGTHTRCPESVLGNLVSHGQPCQERQGIGCLEKITDQESPVVDLNVGGEFYTTTLGTLRKFPGSKLAEMFSSPAKACLDAEGRFFIDRCGTYFGPILEYLRSGQLPTQHIPEVYREAQYYEIKPLIKHLEDTPQIFGEQVARKQFLLQVPGYSENLELMVRLARAEAVAARCSRVLVCLVRNEKEDASCADALRSLEANKRSVVKFGPWKAALDISDLLDCLNMDIKAQGYQVCYSHNSPLPAKVSDYFYTFSFSWW